MLSHVCQQWRAIALSTPALWNRLNISEKTSKELIRAHLVHSRDVPLDIHLVLRPQTHFNILKELLVLLVPQLYRWRTFKFRSELLVGVMMSLQGKAAPVLEEFDVHDPFAARFHPRDMYRYVLCDLFAGAESAPRLKSVRLHSVPVRWGNHPFRSLTHLDIRYLTNGTTSFQSCCGKP